MKKMNKLTSVIGLLTLLVVASSCSSDSNAPDKNPEVKFEANLTPQNIVGTPVTSSATGRFDGVYNKDTRIMKFTITYSGMTPSEGLFFIGFPFENGSPFTYSVPRSKLQSPISDEFVVTQKQENDLFNVPLGRTYVMLTSAKFPKGEIRGNLIQTASITNK
jgi:CHRD domain